MPRAQRAVKDCQAWLRSGSERSATFAHGRVATVQLVVSAEKAAVRNYPGECQMSGNSD